MATVRVLLVDDDALVRAGLRLILSSADDIEVVGEADDGARAVAAVREHRPDVVLMDIRMAEMDGITATAALRRLDSPPQVIVLTTFQADEQVMSALRAGASGFLVKDTPPADIINAVRVVASGDAIISPSVTRTLLSHFANGQASERRRSPRSDSPRSPTANGRSLTRSGPARPMRRSPLRAVHERGDGQGARVAAVHQARRRQPSPDRDRRPRRRPVVMPTGRSSHTFLTQRCLATNLEGQRSGGSGTRRACVLSPRLCRGRRVSACVDPCALLVLPARRR